MIPCTMSIAYCSVILSSSANMMMVTGMQILAIGFSESVHFTATVVGMFSSVNRTSPRTSCQDCSSEFEDINFAANFITTYPGNFLLKKIAVQIGYKAHFRPHN